MTTSLQSYTPLFQSSSQNNLHKSQTLFDLVPISFFLSCATAFPCPLLTPFQSSHPILLPAPWTAEHVSTHAAWYTCQESCTPYAASTFPSFSSQFRCHSLEERSKLKVKVKSHSKTHPLFVFFRTIPMSVCLSVNPFLLGSLGFF